MKRITAFFRKGDTKHPRIEEAADSSPSGSSDSSGQSECPKTDVGGEKRPESRHFQAKWLQEHPWLQYEQNAMFCKVCQKTGKKNAFSAEKGCTNFRTSTLTRHISGQDHKNAVEEDAMRGNMKRSVERAFSEQDRAIIAAFRAVYWLAKENIATMKYASLLKLLHAEECPSLEALKAGENATYESRHAAEEMQDSISTVIKLNIDQKLDATPVLSILCNESTDISVAKKLVVYVRIVTENFEPETHLIQNIEVKDGKAQTITDAIKVHVIDKKKIPAASKIVGFGSDGAIVMTSKKEGVAGKLRRNSPFMLNVHCVAHRLALCSSQAADEIPYMKKHQETLTSIFYHFKKSAVRTSKVMEIQGVLDNPILKYKEIHAVRWFSCYSALETVFRTWGALVTYFEQDMVKDSKSKGYVKTLTEYRFVATTYLLMDVIPILTALCLIFQKDDLDISLVQATVQGTISRLTALLTRKGPYEEEFTKAEATEEGGKFKVKGHSVSVNQLQKTWFGTMKTNFIQALLDNLEKRFPRDSTEVVEALSVLAMRTLTFVPAQELPEFGNDKLEILTQHFGTRKTDSDGSEVEPLVDAEAVKSEWAILKQVVLQQKYPRDKLSTLWKLIYTYHRDVFPNLLKLAAVALVLPVQTAVCERGFSAQNMIKVSARNRLSAKRLDTLMLISTEGPELSEFSFKQAVQHWKTAKDRRLFQA